MTAPARINPPSRCQQRGDSAGLIVSGLCLAHCLAAPALFALIPAFGFGLGAAHRPGHELDLFIHGGLLLLAAPISAFSLRRGLRCHGRRHCVAMALVGLGFMLAGVLLHTPEHGEIWLTVIGVVILAIAHITNWHASLNRASWPTASTRAVGPAR